MSLKSRHILIGFSIPVTAALPNADAAENDQIETITVTASHLETTADEQLTVVNRIDRDQIELMDPKSVVDILETLPGVSVTRTGGAGQTASVSIRGAASDHVLVLLDGVRIGSATLGSTNFEAISPEQIDRIEVVKGPRAAVWGSDAIGGVIQIFSRKLEQGDYAVNLEVGSDEYRRYGAAAGVSHGDGQTTVTASYESSDGFDVLNNAETDDDGYDRTSIGISGHQQLSQQFQLKWQGQYADGSNEYDDQFGGFGANESDFANYFWNLSAVASFDTWRSHFALGQSRDQMDNYRDDVVPKQRFETEQDQLSWRSDFSLNESWQALVGADWRRESVNGDYSIDERDIYGVHGLLRFAAGSWLTEVAYRFDDVEDIDSETSANVSLAYRLNDNWRVSLGYGTGFKAPTFNDLYYPDVGNPELKSETSENSEITLHYDRDVASAYLSTFVNQVDDLINWTPTGEFDEYGWEIWRPNNVDEAKLKGLEFGAEVAWLSLLHQIGYTYLDSADKNSSTPLIGRSRHEAEYSATYRWQSADVSLRFHHQGKRFNGVNNGSKTYVSSYNQVDFASSYRFDNGWRVRMSVNNLFDQDTVSVANYNAPGRNWFVNIGYENF